MKTIKVNSNIYVEKIIYFFNKMYSQDKNKYTIEFIYNISKNKYRIFVNFEIQYGEYNNIVYFNSINEAYSEMSKNYAEKFNVKIIGWNKKKYNSLICLLNDCIFDKGDTLKEMYESLPPEISEL